MPSDPAPVLSLMARLGRLWITWRGLPAFADQMKRGHGGRIAWLVRKGVFDDPRLLGQVLLVAITHAERAIVDAALSRKASANWTHGGNTVLHWAMAAYSPVHEPERRERALAILKALLESGADMEVSNRHGRSAWQEIEQRPAEIGTLFHAEHTRRVRHLLDASTLPAMGSNAPRRI